MMTIREILKLDSGLYTADVDGKPAVIGRDKGKGFTIRIESTPGWDMITIMMRMVTSKAPPSSPKTKQQRPGASAAQHN